MGDAQSQQKPATVQLCQTVLALFCCSGIASIDVGDAAGDDQTLRVGQQEAAESKGFICVQARYQARGEVQRRLTDGLSTDQRRRLDVLTQRRGETNQSWLAWLRQMSGEAGRDARSDRAPGPCPRSRP